MGNEVVYFAKKLPTVHNLCVAVDCADPASKGGQWQFQCESPDVRRDDPEYPVTLPKTVMSDGALQGCQLLAARHVFEDQVMMPTAGRHDCPQAQHERLQRAVILSPVTGQPMPTRADSGLANDSRPRELGRDDDH
jgi:hypothetical protein